MQPIWSSIRTNDDGWLEFVISQYGIEQWRQRLIQQSLPTLEVTSEHKLPLPISVENLWKLQSGYELCCRWQNLHHQMGLWETHDQIASMEANNVFSTGFQVPSPHLHTLIHGLLDICDRWDEAKPPQLLQQANQLIQALEQCTAITRPASPAAKEINHWLAPTQIVLKQLLHERLSYHMAAHF
ncbi:hypothetical protein IXB50_00700 [Leptothoe spongobia TAU-MAC 1115]|uniref:Uncharacterized protein n=2 Tax=Leptothoe TaxID=2651725 RepID=A0A947DAN3_9CYAN|nr:hypothetical protein [Leptothoe spongobia TAU-MAC 1115]